MMATAAARLPVQIHEPGLDGFREEVLRGLRRQPKQIPSKFFYDEAGSRLFDQICDLEEYYLTRVEMEILRCHGRKMAAAIGPECRLIEFGSGSGLKTRRLLDLLKRPASYVSVDISREQLMASAAQIAAAYPGLEVHPVYADYTGHFDLPEVHRRARRTVAFFPGSTIGNFEPPGAVEFLRRMSATCGRDGGLLIGVDLKKDPVVLHRAYNDRDGVTAAFNLNLLARLQRELGAEINPDQFAHYAPYNPSLGRIEMHLVSLADQLVRLGGVVIPFRQGESILTEYSYKYDLHEFAQLVAEAGFGVERVWTDERHWFSVQYLVAR